LVDILSETIIRETGTLGVRTIPYVHRNIVSREIVPVKVDFEGQSLEVRVKVAKIGEEIVNVTVEYEDARKISEKLKMPLKDVIRFINRNITF
jgi:hypothetical protein